MDRWKTRGGKSQIREEKRREEKEKQDQRERIRRKKMSAPGKVEKLPNTAFSNDLRLWRVHKWVC